MNEIQKAIEKVCKLLLSMHICTFLDKGKGLYPIDMSHSWWHFQKVVYTGHITLELLYLF